MSNSFDLSSSVAYSARSSASSGSNHSSNDDGASAVSGADPQSGRTVARHPGEAGVRGPWSGFADGVRAAASHSLPRSPFLLVDAPEAASIADGAEDNSSVVVVPDEDWMFEELPPLSFSLSGGSDADAEQEDDEDGSALIGPPSASDVGDPETAAVGVLRRSVSAMALRRESASAPDALLVTVTDGQWLAGAYRPATPSPTSLREDGEAEEADAGPSRDVSSSSDVDGEALPSEDEGFDVVYGDEQVADATPRLPERGSLRALQQARRPTSSAASASAAMLRDALGTVRDADLSRSGRREVEAYLRDVVDFYALSANSRDVVENVLDRQSRVVQNRAAKQEMLDHSRAVISDCLAREAALARGATWPAIWAQDAFDDD